MLCYQVGDRDVAKDLLQDTYLTALRSLDQYRGDGPLIGWLRTIALRKSLDWKRMLWRRIRKLQAFVAESPTHTSDHGDAKLEVKGAAFRRALGRLSSRQRAALLLRELEGLSFREIATVLSCSEATCRVHHLRARENMRRMLGTGDEPVLVDEMGGQQA